MADDDELPKQSTRPAQAAEPQPAPAPVVTLQRTARRPLIVPGLPIGEYTDTELRRLAQWIRSDDVLRTEEEMIGEMMRELGFQRRGKNVVTRITTAVRHTHP
jgi:hypothetical protein